MILLCVSSALVQSPREPTSTACRNDKQSLARMATGKRQRDSTVIDELQLPEPKRHATAGGPLKGLQKVSTQAHTMNIQVQCIQLKSMSLELSLPTFWLMPLYASDGSRP